MTNRLATRLWSRKRCPIVPEYWLGIRLRADDKGILVQEVVADSPAAKAGMAQNDVILKADDKQISNVADVLKAVEAAKDKEMKLEILRDGQPKTIAITPAKRPEEARFSGPPLGSDFEGLRKWIEQLQQGGGFGQQGPLQFRFMRPGLILPRACRCIRRCPETCRLRSQRRATSRRRSP